MNLNVFIKTCALLSSLLVASCAPPISDDAVNLVDHEATLAMAQANPDALIGKRLLLGGSIHSIEETDDTIRMEILEWQLNSYGEPLYLKDEGLKFLVNSPRDRHQRYEAGVLVTLVGTLSGKETRVNNGTEYNYPVFNLNEIHVWDIPLRFGIHRNQDPGYPHYEEPPGTDRRNPYDPGYTDYPYSPNWLRRLTH